jgi:AcrR family transcriptional regulator
MEKGTRKKTSTKKEITAAQIQETYLDYLLSKGSQPASVYAFAKDVGMQEAEFYNHFSSFEAIEKGIWKDIMESTMKSVVNDENYAPFSAREKMLSLYFTLIESLKSKRSYVSLRWPKRIMPGHTPEFLKDFKMIFFNWTNDILNDGKDSGEVVIRPYVSERYDQAAWLQMLFIIDFWVKDASKAFEATDAAIEKTVNLGFDLMGPGPLDSMVDFGKFLISQRK